MIKDITDNKLTEEALREGEERYRTILDDIEDGYFEVDIAGNFTFFNDSMCKILGYLPNEMMGMNNQEYMDEGNARKVYQTFNRVYITGIPAKGFDWELIRKDGKRRFVEASVSPMKSSTGKAIGFRGIVRDITERKRAEEALRENEERYQALFEQAIVPVYIFDPHTKRVLEANSEFFRILGYSVEELETLHVYDFIAHNKESVDRDIEHVLKEGSRDIGVRNWRRKDGTLVHVIVTASLIQQHGKDIVCIIANDITELKQAEEDLRQSEQKYRSLFEESKDEVYITTPEGKILDVNPAGVKLFGYSSKEELLRVDIPRQLYWNSHQREEYKRLLDKQGYVKDFELEMKTKDGKKIVVLDTGSVVRDSSGNIVAYRGIVRDITERKSLEEQLRHSQKLESLGTLVGGIAHDFNNILGIIIGHASLLQVASIDKEEVSRRAEAIMEATERGASLVKQMMTFARKTEPVFQPLDLNMLVKEFAKMINETFPKTIKVCSRIAQDLPPVVSDATQIHQVLLNLCINARDAMPKGGTLTISTKRVNAEKLGRRFPNLTAQEYVVLTVADTGIGMDKNTQRRLFEPFFTTKPPGHGTGLGLATVYGIVSSHGGFIHVESEPGKGAAFRVYMPAAEKPVLYYQTSDLSDVEVNGGSETILIVDDEEYLRQFMESLLISKGYNILIAKDGEQAVEIYREHHKNIALVISDMGLPRLSGEDVFRQIRKVNPNAKVILASGLVEPVLESELLKAGVQEFIMKPYTQTEVLVKTRKVLDAKI